VWFSAIFGFLVDVSGILILMESSRILGLVELGGLFRYRVDVSGNFRFWFRV